MELRSRAKSSSSSSSSSAISKGVVRKSRVRKPVTPLKESPSISKDPKEPSTISKELKEPATISKEAEEPSSIHKETLETSTGQIEPSIPSNAPPVVSSWGTRTRWTIILLVGFAGIIAVGHPALTLLIFLCHVLMYKEIVAIGFKWSKEKQLPLSRTMNWYFYTSVCFFIYTHTLHRALAESKSLMEIPFFRFAVQYYVQITTALLIWGVVAFTLLLKKDFYKYQFQQLAWTTMSLIFVVCPSAFILSNMYQGIFWFILPALLVVTNDIFAFIFGKLFGRTPLIALSPKKTWEGFFGGMLVTFLLGFVLPWWFSRYHFLVCPKHSVGFGYSECDPSVVFVPITYKLPRFLHSLLRIGLDSEQELGISIYPSQWVGLVFAAFASFIAPFGGFVASGFKRAYGIKDFGSSIPGQGGVMDRMDCQVLMGLFVYIFYNTVFGSSDSDVSFVLEAFRNLNPADQLVVFQEISNLLNQS